MKITAQIFEVGNANHSLPNSPVMGAQDASESHVVIPGGAWPLTADYLRQGLDLLVSGKDGQSFVVRDYFLEDTQADIHTEGGAVLPANIVDRLTTGPAPGQYAQSAPTQPDADVVGRVETVLGTATALRSDGSQVTLTAGDPIHAGDVLQTAAEASLGVEFADKTTLSLGAEGRLVVDDFVYDPEANTGSMNVNVVQGVFTFVSGEIAKLGPDMMTVYTPVATVGIRGTKVAGRAAAEGEENTISLLPNDDGTVGVIAVANQSGAAPQILTSAGATTTVTSQFQAPAPQVFLSQNQIQQQYGPALQTLNVTRQAVENRQEAAPAEVQEGEAGTPGDGEGEAEAGEPAGPDQDASETPAEGEEVSDEEQAARDAADAAAREGESTEETLEAAIEAAADRAIAEGASPEEVAEAEAAARDAFNAAIENGESPEDALESALAAVGEAAFTQPEGNPDLAQNPGPGDGQAGDVQLGNPANGQEGQDAVLGAAETAAEGALADGASEEQAFDAAVQAAIDAAVARGEDPEEVARIAAQVRETHADAIESGLDPIDAMKVAFNTGGGDERGFSPVGDETKVAEIDPNQGESEPIVSAYDDRTGFERTIGAPIELPPTPVIPPITFTVPVTASVVTTPPTEDAPDPVIVVTEDTTVFTEEFVATSGADSFSGTAGNSEFVYSQSENGAVVVTATDGNGGAFHDGGGPFTDLIQDSGGTNDRITFEDLDGVGIKMGNLDSSFVEIDIFNTGGSTSAASLVSGEITKIHVSRDVEDLQGSVTNLANLDEGIVVKNALDVTNNETAYILAGSSGNDTLTIDDTNAVGALIFGKDGDDIIQLSSATTDHIMFGGTGTDQVDYTGIAGSVTVGFNTGTISVAHGESSDSFDSIERIITGGNDDLLSFSGAGATGGFESVSGGAGVDRFLFAAGTTASATFDGGAGQDDFIFRDGPGSVLQITGIAVGDDDFVFGRQNFNGDADNDGILDSGTFVSGTGAVALDADDFFIFDTTDNTLYYDADGVGAGAAVAIAQINTGALTTNEIVFSNISDLAGTAGQVLSGIDDLIIGSGTDDTVTLSGVATGGDIFDGAGGDDTLNLGNGANVLTVARTENINGGTGNDAVTSITALGVDGNASLTGGGGTDILNLAAGVNQAAISDFATINGSVGEDQLFLLNNLSGGSTLVDLGSGGDDVLHLSGGTNHLSVSNTETISASDGDDTLTLGNAQAGTQITLGAGTDTLFLGGAGNTVTVNNIESITSTSGGGADNITLAGNTTVTISSNTGFDTVTLATGSTSLHTSDVNLINTNNTGVEDLVLTNILTSGTTVDLGTGADSLTIADGISNASLFNIETVNGTGLANTLTLGSNHTGTSFDFGAGTDALNLAAGANTITATNIEQINGSASADTIQISNNLTSGETIDAGGGVDTVQLADGANSVFLLAVETLNGGGGADTLSLTSGVSGTTFDLGSGSDTLNLGTGTNSLTVTNTETVVGNSSADTITASGGTGVNITGAGGADVITLGSGADIIKYSAISDSTSVTTDIVNGFNALGVDLIDVSAFVQGVFSFISGNGAFTNTGNTEARFNDGNDTLQIDSDGDTVVDMEIILNSVTDSNLSDADFITI